MNTATAWRLREGVLAQLELAEAILLDTRSGHYFELNAVGTCIVRALLEGVNERELHRRVAARFDVDADQARSDCAAFLDTLRARNLLAPM
jgi:hypothetical protein